MSPLIEYVGNATPQDRTEFLTLNPAADGTPRSLAIGKRALVSGKELRSLAASYQVKVVEDTDEKDSSEVPTKMPSGYDDDGYKEGESPDTVVFTAEDYPDPEGADKGEATADVSTPDDTSSSTAAADQAGSAPAGSPPQAKAAPQASPAPIPSVPPASAAPSSSPDSPGASG